MTFGPISTLPALLPQLFGLTGQSIPKAFEEVVQPTLDILDMLSVTASAELIIAANIAQAGTGFVLPPELQVPPTEAWLVRGCSVICTVSATQQIRLRLAAARVLSPASYVIHTDFGEAYSSPTDAAAVAGFAVAASPGPFLLGPGDAIIGVAETLNNGGSSVTVAFRAAIYRFTV